MDPTASTTNVVTSIKSHLIQTIEVEHGKKLSFDSASLFPNFWEPPIEEWVTVSFDDLIRGGLAHFQVRIFCCTRMDPEGVSLTQLSDVVVGVLEKKDIPLLQYGSPPQPIEPRTCIRVAEITESKSVSAPDGTQYKILNIRLMWAMKQ